MGVAFVEKHIFYLQEKLKEGIASKIEILPDCATLIIKIANNKTIKLNINDINHTVSNTILERGYYEKCETEMMYEIISYLPENSVLFDIGANTGYYSLCYKTWFPDADVYSFEPLPDIYITLFDNVQLNFGSDTKGIIINNYGFFDKEQVIEFYYNDKEGGASSIKNIREIDEAKKVKCSVTTLDSFVEKNKLQIDFIKCDVEGAELFVFKGGIQTLKDSKPVIFTEMLRKWSALFNYHPNDIISLLSDIGYKCFVIKDMCLSPFITVTGETVETNYIFIHSSKLELFKELIIS